MLVGISPIVGVLGSVQPPRVAIADRDVTSASATSPDSAQYILRESGEIGTYSYGFSLNHEDWLLTGVSSDYEAWAEQTSGDPLYGTFNSWLPLSTYRVWQANASTTNTPAQIAGETRAGTMLLKIREAASPYTVLDQATITMSATWG